MKPKSELAGFFNSLHTDARFHVGAILYYVSLHTSAESTFYAFFPPVPKTCFSFVFLRRSIHVPIYFTSLFLYNLLRCNQIGFDHDHMCRKDVEDALFLCLFCYTRLSNFAVNAKLRRKKASRINGSRFVVILSLKFSFCVLL